MTVAAVIISLYHRRNEIVAIVLDYINKGWSGGRAIKRRIQWRTINSLSNYNNFSPTGRK